MISRILELVYPENIYCMCCGSIIDKTRSYALCDTCMNQFSWNNKRMCSKCGKRLQDTYIGELCYSCIEKDHNFDKAFSCVSYGNNERALIADMKYKDRPYIGRKIGEIMADRMELEDLSYDIVTCVPVHEKRLNKRGFNQAEIIAKEFAKRVKIEYTECVLRKEDTLPMKGLSVEERAENLKDVFCVNKDVKEKDILVVDDIYTTGASLDAIAYALKKNGAKHVYGISFASSVNRRPSEIE